VKPPPRDGMIRIGITRISPLADIGAQAPRT
jgi:hypothetical protein